MLIRYFDETGKLLVYQVEASYPPSLNEHVVLPIPPNQVKHPGDAYDGPLKAATHRHYVVEKITHSYNPSSYSVEVFLKLLYHEIPSHPHCHDCGCKLGDLEGHKPDCSMFTL